MGRYRGLVLPGLLILVGAVALAANLNLVQWDALYRLLDLWPVVLILVGVELVLRALTSRRVASAAGLVLIFLAALGAIAYTVLAPPIPTGGQTLDSTERVTELTSAALDLTFGAADVNVHGESLGGALFKSHIEYGGQKPDVSFDRSTGRLTISDRSQGFRFLFGSFFDIGTLIACLTSTIVLVQALGQVAAVIVLRRRQPDLPRPYRMWLYPVPAVVAAVLWFCAYIVFAVPDQRLAANNPAHPTWLPVAVSLGVVAAGAVAFLVWARIERTWPFGPNEIREEYVQAAEAVSGPA